MIVFFRSNDLGAGAGVNVASYALLCSLLAKATEYLPGVLTYQIGDAHIYADHLDGIKKQIERSSYPAPKLEISDRLIGSDLKDVRFEDVSLSGYHHHAPIKFEMTV